jgi:hypothetical protein
MMIPFRVAVAIIPPAETARLHWWGSVMWVFELGHGLRYGTPPPVLHLLGLC